MLVVLATASAAPRALEIDFEAVEITAERPAPAVLVVERPAAAAAACNDLLTLGLPELPSLEGLGTRAGRRQLRAAARTAELTPEERDLALAKAHTCFTWTYGGPRTTAGIYAWFVRQADVRYCIEHRTTYHGLAPEDLSALDEATALDEYCLMDPWGRPLRRNPYEAAQTAISEAHQGTFRDGGAAAAMYRRVVRRAGDGVTVARFLEVLRELDASGEPAAAFMAGTSDRPWTARELERAVVERLAPRGPSAARRS